MTIFLCFLVAMLEGFDIQAVGLVGPHIAKIAKLDRGQLGAVFAASNVGLAIGAAFGGWLADKIGRKPVLVFAALMFGLMTLATLAAGDYGSFLIVRVLTGFGLGAAMPNLIAIATEVSPPGGHVRATTTIFCAIPFGSSLSAVYVANMPAQFDWRSVFVIGGVAPLIIAGLIFGLLRETRSARSTDTSETPGRVGVLALFTEGRGLSTALVWVAFFFTMLLLYIMSNWLPIMAADRGLSRPLDLSVGGVRVGLNPTFAFTLSGVAGALIYGQLIDRLGFRLPTLLAYIAAFVGLIGLAYAKELGPMLVCSAVIGFFLLGAIYAFYGVVASYYSPEVRGVGAGFATAMGRVGSIVGPVIAGVMMARGMGVTQTIAAAAPAAVIAGAAVLLLSLRKPVTADGGFLRDAAP